MKTNITLIFLVGLTGALAAHIHENGDHRVVGGNMAAEGQFPYQVSIKDRWGEHGCGGSILDETTILTAAHCVNGPIGLKVVTGSNKLNESGGVYTISSFSRHQSYDGLFFKANDIAILKLSTPIVFNEKVQPIQLRTSEILAGEDCILSGWGLTSYNGKQPNDLQYLKLKTIDYETCKEKQTSSLIFSSMLCTLTQAGQGACNGDSGGPLVDLEGKQIGIVSWGTPCALGRPDVFTRIPDFLDWIEDHS